MLSPREVARHLNVSVHTLKKWRAIDVGPPYYEIGGQIRYSKKDIEGWLSDQHRTPENGSN